jgi:hypothetical protein
MLNNPIDALSTSQHCLDVAYHLRSAYESLVVSHYKEGAAREYHLMSAKASFELACEGGFPSGMEVTARQCGEADSYYRRQFFAHYRDKKGDKVEVTKIGDSSRWQAYCDGWEENEELGDYKDWEG